MVVPPYSVNDLLIKPTYDVAFYGQDIVIPIGTDTLALQSLTWSDLDELLQASTPNTDANLNPYSRLVSDINTLGIANEGDGVQFSRTYEWLSNILCSSCSYSILSFVCIWLSF